MVECPYVPPAAPSSTPADSAPSAAALEASDPLLALNQAFRDAYAQRRDGLVPRMGPVIAQIDDVLILRHGDQRLEGPARTRRYHELKAIDHLPLALYVLLADSRKELSASTRERLTELRGLLVAVADSMGRRGFGPEQLARQRRIVDASRALVERVLDEGRVASETVAAFARAQVPELLRNAEDAARDQIETMHTTVEAWKARMTPEEWNQLRAVVAVAHMSAPGNVALQYFSVTLGEDWEGRFDQEDLGPGKRVLTSEASSDEAQAFALLATHTLDSQVGRRFFGEEARLTRDVLADAAERILTEMFGERPEPSSGPGSAKAQ